MLYKIGMFISVVMWCLVCAAIDFLFFILIWRFFSDVNYIDIGEHTVYLIISGFAAIYTNTHLAYNFKTKFEDFFPLDDIDSDYELESDNNEERINEK